MTRDDVIRIAREAGFRAGYIDLSSVHSMPYVAPYHATDLMTQIERFAELVAKHEREACAKVCEATHANGTRKYTHPDECALAIRERGAK